MDSAIQFAFQIVILIFSVVIHEVSHGFAALALGDKTAQYAGRLTLNPLKHVDPFGSVFLPLLLIVVQSPILFGWAKPVPYNPYNLRNQKWGPALVGAAGPAVNLLLAIVFGTFIRISPAFLQDASSAFVFNFITIASVIAVYNLSLAVLNLLPIPPLDGSKVFFAVLPYRWRGVSAFLEQYGFFLLLVVVFLFSRWLWVVVLFLFRLLAGIPPVL